MTTIRAVSGDALDLEALHDAAVAAARAGGEVVASHFGAPRDIRQKRRGDWVSAADHESEEVIAAILARETGLPVFGEELGGERAFTGWLVDPLDGTANFLHGFVAVGVSVALVHDGAPVVGVVHAPLLGQTWHAVAGGGAFRDAERISVSDRPPVEAIVATGFPFRRKDLVASYLAAFREAFASFEDLRRVGAASLDLCWAADGTFDGFFELALGPWDVAAGGLVVREAGGVVTDWTGDSTAWLTSGDILAGRAAVHERLLEIAHPAADGADVGKSFDGPDGP